MEAQTYIYRLSYQEWIAGIRLARRRSPWWMFRYLASWLIPLLLVYLLAALLWNMAMGHAPTADALNGAFVITLLLAGIVGYRIFQLRRIYKRSAIAQNEAGLALAFNDEYFVSGLPGRSESRFLWPALYDFAENENIALIYTSPKGFIVVPKQAMPPESWDVLRTLVPQRKKHHAD